MNDELDGAGRTHIDRRTLLKRAGAAGALGLAAPIAFDSFFSPAAACSGIDVAVLSLTSWTRAQNNQGNGGTLDSPSVTPTSGALVIIAFNMFWNSGTAPTSVAVGGTSISSPSQLTSVVYETPTGSSYRLYVFTAQGTGVAGAVTINPGTNRSDNFVGQVFQLTSTPQPTVSGTVDTAPGTGATASVALAPDPVGTGNGQLLIVAGHPNDVTTGDWSVPSAFPGAGQVADTFSDDGANDLSLASFYDPIANTGDVSSTFTGSAVITSAATWGAVTLEVAC